MKIFKHPVLIGYPCFIDEGFEASLTELCQIANVLDIKIFITSSHRDSIVVPGAIVTPAVMSNHLVGHAIDCNLVEKNGTYWNSEKLKGELTGNVLKLIDEVRKHPALRWGGDFKQIDVVHFDDGLNIHEPVKYKEILHSLEQKHC